MSAENSPKFIIPSFLAFALAFLVTPILMELLNTEKGFLSILAFSPPMLLPLFFFNGVLAYFSLREKLAPLFFTRFILLGVTTLLGALGWLMLIFSGGGDIKPGG